jgi:hypothetical protein
MNNEELIALKSKQSSILRDLRREEMAQGLYDLPSNNFSDRGEKYDETYPADMNGNRTYVEDNFCDTIGIGEQNEACPCFGCQCEPNQVTKDAIEEARNRNDPR